MPDFRPPNVEEMRELWTRHRDPDVRRLLLEIDHLRRVLTEIETLRAAVERSWKVEVGGHLAALHMMRCRLQEERVRIGILGGVATGGEASSDSRRSKK